MLDFARAIIWPHFDSLMSITGVGGKDASAFYSVADECIEKVLRSIAGYARMNAAALRIESGVWDTKTRAQMLLMRLHAKICCSDQHFLISRVVKMSMAALTPQEYAEPAARWSFSNHVHKQSWAQQILAAADGLDMPKESVKNMAPGLLLDIQEERCMDGARVWEDVLDVGVYKPSCVREVRLVLKQRPVDGKYVEGVNCWSVYASDIQEGKALFGQWLGPMRLAMHAAIPGAEACEPQEAEAGSRVHIEVDCRRQSLERMGVDVGPFLIYARILECIRCRGSKSDVEGSDGCGM